VRFSEHHEKYRGELPARERISLNLCERAVSEAVESRRQADGRIQFWGYVEEEDRYLKVVLEPDTREIITAHFDRGFKSKMRRQR
jgi:G:T/U-mismatch repair DNA glycosylase